MVAGPSTPSCGGIADPDGVGQDGPHPLVRRERSALDDAAGGEEVEGVLVIGADRFLLHHIVDRVPGRLVVRLGHRGKFAHPCVRLGREPPDRGFAITREGENETAGLTLFGVAGCRWDGDRTDPPPADGLLGRQSTFGVVGPVRANPSPVRCRRDTRDVSPIPGVCRTTHRFLRDQWRVGESHHKNPFRSAEPRSVIPAFWRRLHDKRHPPHPCPASASIHRDRARIRRCAVCAGDIVHDGRHDHTVRGRSARG